MHDEVQLSQGIQFMILIGGTINNNKSPGDFIPYVSNNSSGT
jgi:hypothetical protein